eukprot:6351304-Lingulodinium_polyedra.AAC.1
MQKEWRPTPSRSVPALWVAEPTWLRNSTSVLATGRQPQTNVQTAQIPTQHSGERTRPLAVGQ